MKKFQNVILVIKNLCNSCKSFHDIKHNIIDYKIKNFICNIHNQPYIQYCKECKINLCLLCESNHENHNIIKYNDIQINTFTYLNKMKEMKEMKYKINELKTDIKKINEMINTIINN